MAGDVDEKRNQRIQKECQMLSPFEELEWVADYLPEEGQSVVISRESGSLVCQPHVQCELRDGVDDAELYGRLMQMNVQLSEQSVFPLWVSAGIVFWGTLLIYGLLAISTSHWYLAPGLGFVALMVYQYWSRIRREAFFETVIQPHLERTIARRRVRPHALLAGISQHPELQTLHRELIRWIPEANHPERY